MICYVVLELELGGLRGWMRNEEVVELV